jgi:hypothetical protein
VFILFPLWTGQYLSSDREQRVQCQAPEGKLQTQLLLDLLLNGWLFLICTCVTSLASHSLENRGQAYFAINLLHAFKISSGCPLGSKYNVLV